MIGPIWGMSSITNAMSPSSSAKELSAPPTMSPMMNMPVATVTPMMAPTSSSALK